MRFTIVVALVLLGVCAVYSVPLEKSKLKKSLLNKISGSPSTKQARSHLLKKFFDDSEEDCDIEMEDICDGWPDCLDGSDEDYCDLFDSDSDDDDDMFKKRTLFKKLLKLKRKK